jgi:hypothetical protein
MQNCVNLIIIKFLIWEIASFSFTKIKILKFHKMKLTKTLLLAIALISMVYANGMILLSASLFTVIRTLSR